ncbi:MAG: rhomboid family intramembrane serine protease [Gemmatimonadota bacterium]
METSTEFNAADFEPGVGITPAVQWLIALNVLVYFIQLTSPVGTADVAAWLGLSATEFPAHWWAIGTYMFVHAGFAHIATNMIMLWMFGPRVERAFGTRAFTYFYLWCGLGGGIFHLLFEQHSGVIGASGAVVGVVLAYALKWPDDEVYILGVMPIRAVWLAVWTIAWNVGMAFADFTGYSSGSVAFMTHVGGLVFAWIYLHAPNSSSFDKIRRHVATVPDDSNPQPIPKMQRPQKRRDGLPSADEAVARSNAIVKRRPQTPMISAPNPNPKQRAEDVNGLLDKISREGMGSLSGDERALLQEISRKLRGS